MEQIKKYIIDTFSDISFNSVNHTYFRNNNKYISTSSFISVFHKEFDSDKFSKLVAKRDNKTVEDVLAEWEEKKNVSLKKGNNAHNFAERYFKDNSINPETNEEKAVVKFFKSLDKRYIPLFSEKILFSDIFMIAGTTDLLLYDTELKSIVVADWKTNADLFKSYNKLFTPFEFLKDSSLNKYKLQLSTYKLMLEEYNIKVSNAIIVWLRSDGEFVNINVESYSNKIKRYLTL